MPKRQTPIQKLVTFAMGVTEEELNGALDTIKAIKDSRFPKTVKAARKPRADKGAKRTPPPAPATDSSASGE